ncbi:MAG: carboxypeptidase regulatory-like domain-containing protein [Blastocatellia bacterium]|nr:carboxypeptidase regulatory-like domain-containing protein [Blastocatellia bacterium]
MTRKICSVIGVIALVLGLALSAAAQSSRGTLVGTVKDSSGAVISGGTVKIINQQTNVTRETVTLENGNFRFDAVDPGTYKVEVVASGFRPVLQENIIVSAGQTANTPFQLEVGNADGEVIQVTAESTVALQTQDGARSNTIDSRQIVDLPTGSASTSPIALVFTLPGVVVPGLAGGNAQGVEFSINGVRSRGNSFLLDSTDNNDSNITGQSLRAFLRDGYQEVSVLGGNNSAEYGRAGGAVVNLVTKGGTNQFHGSVYDLIIPSAMTALTSGQKINQGLTSVPVTITNQYGFSLGGPIIKDKLFFFTSLQFYDFRAGSQVVTGIFPTADGAALLRSVVPQGRSSNLDTYLAAIGNLRGTASIRPIQLGGGRPNINFGIATTTYSAPFDDRQFLARVDYALSNKDLLSFRYVSQDQTSINQVASVYDGQGISVNGVNRNGLMTYTHTFSPSLTNELRIAYSRSNAPFFPQSPAALQSGPNVTITGVTGYGLAVGFPQDRVLNNYQYQDTVTWTRGNHSIRAGFDLNRQLEKILLGINDRGTLSFTSSGNDTPNDSSDDFPAFGNFVDGFSGTQGGFAAKSFGVPVIYPKGLQQAYFINDIWRLKPNLTVTAGLRYENFGTPFNSIPFPAFAGFNAPLNTVKKQNRDNNNFAPRVSFAYTPRFAPKWFGNDRTVIRGGYGVSYDTYFNNILFNTANSSPNLVGVTTFGSTAGGRGFANAGPALLPTTAPALNPLTAVTSVDPNLRNPLTHTWNLGMQRETIGGVLVDVAYVGTRGTRLFFNEDLNPGVNGRRIYPNRGAVAVRSNGADSIYHALQTRVERGFKNGVFARYAYTYSKAIDNNSEVFVTTGGSSRPSNLFKRNDDRSVASFDATHRHTLSFIWDIPGPKKGWLGQVGGGWTVSGIYNIQTGAVETPYLNGFDINRDLNAFNDRPAIGNANAPANSVAILASLFGLGKGYVDANGEPIDPNNARYIVDPARRTNLVGRNSIRANRTNFLDFTINKGFKLPWEGHKFEIRVELFNAFNHPNYTWDATVSSGDVFDPNFNNVRLNDGGSRSGRIQLRYSF